jgi:fructose-bisphosphate aldolase class I
MKSWAKGGVKDAQAKWLDRAKWSSAASLGKYNGDCPS